MTLADVCVHAQELLADLKDAAAQEKDTVMIASLTAQVHGPNTYLWLGHALQLHDSRNFFARLQESSFAMGSQGQIAAP